jgi:hypothetical protein
LHSSTPGVPNDTAWTPALDAVIGLRTRLSFLFLSAFFLLAGPLRAQQSTDQVWPEIDIYDKLNSYLRVSFMSTHAKDQDSTSTTWEFGPSLDIYLKSIRSRRSQTFDSSKRNLLVMRLGYHILEQPNLPAEQRGIFELTNRFYLPQKFLLSERNRLDFRGLSTFSWRYRNRVTLERDFKVRKLAITPYSRAEVFYDITRGVWSRYSYTGGAVFPFKKRYELEPYFERQINFNVSPATVNGFGLTFSVYF